MESAENGAQELQSTQNCAIHQLGWGHAVCNGSKTKDVVVKREANSATNKTKRFRRGNQLVKVEAECYHCGGNLSPESCSYKEAVFFLS